MQEAIEFGMETIRESFLAVGTLHRLGPQMQPARLDYRAIARGTSIPRATGCHPVVQLLPRRLLRRAAASCAATSLSAAGWWVGAKRVGGLVRGQRGLRPEHLRERPVRAVLISNS